MFANMDKMLTAQEYHQSVSAQGLLLVITQTGIAYNLYASNLLLRVQNTKEKQVFIINCMLA